MLGVWFSASSVLPASSSEVGFPIYATEWLLPAPQFPTFVSCQANNAGTSSKTTDPCKDREFFGDASFPRRYWWGREVGAVLLALLAVPAMLLPAGGR